MKSLKWRVFNIEMRGSACHQFVVDGSPLILGNREIHLVLGGGKNCEYFVNIQVINFQGGSR